MVRKNNPHVVRFLRENCIVDTEAEAMQGALANVLRMDASETYAPNLCLQSFYQHCRKAGFKPVTEKQGVIKWRGIMRKPRYSTAVDVRHRKNELDNDALS